MNRIKIIFSILFLVFKGVAFSEEIQTLTTTIIQPSSNIHIDSSSHLNADSKGKAHTKHKKIIPAVDTLTLSDYMMSIDRVNDNLNDLRDSARIGFEIVEMARKVDDITNDINHIRQNVRDKHSVVNLKNLYLYHSFTAHLDEENDDLQTRLVAMYKRVSNAKLQLKKILSDSIFRKLYSSDSTLRNSFEAKLQTIEYHWVKDDSTAKSNIDSLNALKLVVSENAMLLSNMLNIQNDKLDKSGKRLFGNETNYLWERSINDSVSNHYSNSVSSILRSEKKAIGYYFGETSEQRFLILFLGILLFYWLFTKRKIVQSMKTQISSVSFLQLQYVNANPILAIIVFLICWMPLFDAYAPTSYIGIEFLVLLIVASFLFYKKWERPIWYAWIILVVLFVVVMLSDFMVEPTFVARLWLLVLHSTILLFSIRFYTKIEKEVSYFKFIKIAVFSGIVLVIFAIFCNLFGRFSLSGILGIAGIIAITQVMVLPVFIETIIDIILIQLYSSRLKKGIVKTFDSSIVKMKMKLPFLFVAIVLWIIMITSNLNIYHGISKAVIEFATTIRTIGSISFEFVSVFLFFVIIWFAHLLQRIISFMFGETGSEIEDLTSVTKGQHSRLLITRLLVLIGGYLLAIAASGLPIDKLTFLIGALGVGIGMGLQNIVNNFVSGIILIFDGSLQIGDEIEVNGQAGKVKEIGLRASTLNTADGAEVIIPNGNILSQNIVNWTFSNDQRRVFIEFSLTGKELDSNVINEIINKTIETTLHVISKKKAVILYKKVTQDSCLLTVRFWSTTSHIDSVKSDVIVRLSSAFNKNGIVFE